MTGAGPTTMRPHGPSRDRWDAPTLIRGGATLLVEGGSEMPARLDALGAMPGFRGGALMRGVRGLKDKVAYTTWTDLSAAESARATSPSGAMLLEVTDVRLQAAPQDHAGRLPLRDMEGVFLVVQMPVEPARCDELLDDLNTSTDVMLPEFRKVGAVAFHRSPERDLVVEVLNISSAMALALLQLRPRLRRHMKDVNAIANSVRPNLCWL